MSWGETKIALKWHLWYEPDWRLIECIVFQSIFIITFVMALCSFIAIIKANNESKQNIKHWSIVFTLCLLILSMLSSLSHFILLIYQQNGRHWNIIHNECKIVFYISILSFILIPIFTILSIYSYKNWKYYINNKLNMKKLYPSSIIWFELPYGVKGHLDLKYIIGMKRSVKEAETVLLDEQTNEVINDDNNEMEMNNLLQNFNTKNIVFLNLKTKWKIFLFAFITQLLLGLSIQYKNYYDEQQKLFEWGNKFSKLINQNDYYIAKYEIENNIPIDYNEKFESIEWLQHYSNLHPNTIHFV
mmetsp:Transcript_82199/g.100860  ORF Transcript_82199/g.100860 Transcript_82199/m.100860 type:complete len:301 (-) Transcript_82199:13-915(-)